MSEKKHLENIKGIKGISNPEVVEVVIAEDRKTVWVNTEKGCMFRACRIGLLQVDDRRSAVRSLGER